MKTDSIFGDMQGVELLEKSGAVSGYREFRGCAVHFVDGLISDNGEHPAVRRLGDGREESWSSGHFIASCHHNETQ